MATGVITDAVVGALDAAVDQPARRQPREAVGATVAQAGELTVRGAPQYELVAEPPQAERPAALEAPALDDGIPLVGDHLATARLRALLVKRKGRHLHAGQTPEWTRDFFEALGLTRPRGTIRYPEAHLNSYSSATRPAAPPFCLPVKFLDGDA